ncbi:unnamed protein product [Sphenostylis stenocarpa]|uniref:Late embryogenesis abundant protein LEA-2 subgroup domain-containing protein n=1 Tax=Sphenostylis stenocarpa TaxID=92480 RepID=A0AA86SQA5_9FABA|nr:unnamed protein product [Sphenostylis stenocarpa]
MAQSPDQQIKPLAPFISSTHFNRQEDQDYTFEQKKNIRLRKFILCFGCATAIVVLLVVIVLVLGFTVYSVKEPEVRMNRVTLLSGTFANGATDNVTLLADISVKNRNAFIFRFGNATTDVYYDGAGIGVGASPSGKAKARRTIRVNTTIEIMAKKLLENPNMVTDLKDQAFNVSSYTRIHGKVKILNIFPKKVVVKMNCTIAYNITTGLVTNGDNCLGTVDI